MANFIVKTRYYLQLLRVRHWIKNILVFMPLFFSLNFLNPSLLADTVFGFICFSLLSSVVYILNDIRDMEKDRLHSTKRLRPLASGKIPVPHAVAAMVILSVLLIAMLIMVRTHGNRLFSLKAIGLLLLYAILNLAYSWGLKNLPLADVTILASGYVIRVLFGAIIIGVNVSVWLYLVVTLGAYYMGLGKRRNELTGNETGTRTVMRLYSHNFLDKNMYVCQALCVVFYALWSIDFETVERLHTSAFVYTIPIVLIIFFKYSLNIEANADGDPTSVLLGDKVLIFLCVAYIICAFCIVYLNRGYQ